MNATAARHVPTLTLLVRRRPSLSAAELLPGHYSDEDHSDDALIGEVRAILVSRYASRGAPSSVRERASIATVSLLAKDGFAELNAYFDGRVRVSQIVPVHA